VCAPISGVFWGIAHTFDLRKMHGFRVINDLNVIVSLKKAHPLTTISFCVLHTQVKPIHLYNTSFFLLCIHIFYSSFLFFSQKYEVLAVAKQVLWKIGKSKYYTYFYIFFTTSFQVYLWFTRLILQLVM